jgi:predicted hotdog family 3-hydroxylacyl-ACP dehydratase
MQLPISAEDLVPHRLPMRLVDTLVEVEGNNGVAAATIRPECPLFDPHGELEDVALIELVAQSYAALKGYVDTRAGRPVRRGFLTGVKDFHSHAKVRAGDNLKIELTTIADLDHFAVAQGDIYRDGTLVAQAEVKVWIE